jgi:hypothetical protein
MAARADLVEFVRTGELGPVHLGLAPEEVERIPGPPEGIDATGRLWFYRSLEITFFDGVAKLIVVELSDPPTRFPRALDVDVGPFVPGAHSETIKQALDDAGVTWRVDEAWTIDDFQLTLATDAGVGIMFYGDGRLASVNASGIGGPGSAA